MNDLARKIKGMKKEVKDWGAVDFMEDGETPVLTHLLTRWFGDRTDLRILEIGTCRCVGASIMAHHGMVYTIDVNAYDNRAAVLDTFRTKRSVVQIVGPEAEARELVKGMEFDAAFIDGEHKFDPCMRDFAFASSLTKRVMFHDYQPSFPGVVAACDKLKEDVGGDWYYCKKFAAWDGTK